MDTLRAATLSLDPERAAKKARQRVEKTAQQFEDIFVRSMVQSMRQSATVGGEGGLFGSGTGSDTYGDWFDDKIAEQIANSKNGNGHGIGIADELKRQLRKNHELDAAPAAQSGTARKETPAQAAERATQIASRAGLHAANARGAGGIDVRS